tara:strand:+ start:142 stop:483 length:342 start_codon:yes stop_codon:yes gene_type:complete
MESVISLITNSTFNTEQSMNGFHTLKLTEEEHKALKNIVTVRENATRSREQLFNENKKLKEHNEFIQAENEKLREENEGLKSLKQSEINEAVISDEGTAKLKEELLQKLYDLY